MKLTRAATAAAAQSRSRGCTQILQHLIARLGEMAGYAEDLDTDNAQSPRCGSAASPSEQAAWVQIEAEKIAKRLESEIEEIRELEAQAEQLR